MCGPKPYGNFFQYFAAFLGNLLTIGYGFMLGLTPPSLTLYKSSHTPLSNGPLSDDNISWITTMLFTGSIVGATFFKHLSEFFGPRATLLLTGILQNLGWFAVAFGYNYTHVCISRFVVGISGGAAFSVIPAFLIEISITKKTENPYLLTFLAHGFGVMVGIIFGTFTHGIVPGLAGLVISVLFSLSFPFVQESPYHYLKKNDMQMLEKSLRYFRAIRDLDQRSLPEYEKELEKFKQSKQAVNGNVVCKGEFESQHQAGGYSSMSCCQMLQAFLSCLILITTSQLCGLLTIINYSSLSFTTLQSQLPANISTLILGITMFVGSLLAMFIAKCSWRKFIVVAFSLLIGVSLACMGYFLQRDWSDDDDSSSYMKWIPLVCLILAVLLSTASIFPLTFIILADVFTHKTTNVLKTFFHCLHWILGALLIKFHFYIIHCIGMDMYFWSFASVCIFQCVVLVFILPRRTAKNL